MYVVLDRGGFGGIFLSDGNEKCDSNESLMYGFGRPTFDERTILN
jgi:hypothetical protein